MASLLTLTLTLTFILTSSLLPVSPSAFTPTTSFFLTCGSSASTSLRGDNPPRSFVPDSPFLSSASASASQTLSNSSSTISSPLYSTVRLFTAAASYQFETKSQGTYILRLHFFPISKTLSAANFSVSALNRFTLLTDFLVPDSLVIKEYFLSVDTDQFTLTLTPTPNSLAFVNAIELFTAPPNLFDGSNPTNINTGNSLGQLPSPGMETLYRVNVGGTLVTPANDTLWRTWVPDDPYMFDISLSFKNSTSPASVRYGAPDRRRTPEIAPRSVYDTARTMAVTPVLAASNPYFNFNLTWSFAVSPGKTYFVRMHFCDFLFYPVTQLFFNVYVGQSLAYADLQPTSFTDQTPAAAFYLDFAVNSAASGLINVSVGRSNRSTPTTANALLNGLEIMKLGLESDSVTNKHKNSVPMKFLVPSIVGGIVLVAILIAAAVLMCKRRQRPKAAAHPKTSPAASCSPFRPGSISNTPSKSTGSTASPRDYFELKISFEEIRLATDNFDEKLVIGSGGFGKVYKGMLSDGTKVAVKRGVSGSRQGYPEFQTEIEVLSRIRHRHLVSLIGYCEDQSEMILVYEYMDKGPLRNHLYGPESDHFPCLTWRQRLEICIGAARGLHYLHTGYSHNIIHRDIKSTNILLAENYLAKVADFGLSRVGPSIGETHVSTGVKGTFGYLDPEYFKIQKLTDKSDVYSFGVMLFEVLCARPVIDPNQSREQLNLAEWALIWQRKGKLEKIIDQRLVGEINMNSLRKFGEIAAKCLAEYGVDRPKIGDVLWNLEYALQLHETELRREPFEDSGNVESQVPVNIMRRVPSNVATEDINEATRLRMMSEGQSGVSASTVFSQLFTDDGR